VEDRRTVSYPGDARVIRDKRTGVFRRNRERVISPEDIVPLGEHVWVCRIADAEGRPRQGHPIMAFDRVAIE